MSRNTQPESHYEFQLEFELQLRALQYIIKMSETCAFVLGLNNLPSSFNCMTNITWNLLSLDKTIERLERELQSLEATWWPDKFSPSLTPNKSKHMAKAVLLQNLKVIRDQLSPSY